MTQPTYTTEQKAEAARRVAEGESPTIIAREMGASRRSINNWARAAGVEVAQARQEKTAAAVQTLAADHAKKREILRSLLLDKAIDLLGRMDETHKDYRGKDVTAVFWDKAPAGATKDYATAAAILIDKYRLEMGEATGRTESIDLAAAESRLDQEIMRLSEMHNDQHS